MQRRCIRKNCRRQAILHPFFGILPCKICQERDKTISHSQKPQFVNISRLHRIQEQRDQFGKDLLQPYEGNRVNKEFFQAYPDRVKDYQVQEELEKL